MTIMQFIEGKPVVSAGATVAAIVVIVTALFAVDERYAHAGDMRALSVQVEIVALDNRRASLEDKLYDLRARNASKRLPAAEQASLARYESELRDVSRQLQQKRQIADQMKR